MTNDSDSTSASNSTTAPQRMASGGVANGDLSPGSDQHPPVNKHASRNRVVVSLVMGVYLLFVVFTLLAQIKQTFDQPSRRDTVAQADPNVALDTADRILNMIEDILAVIALLLPLALGLMVYLYQRSEDVQEKLRDETRTAAYDARNTRRQTEAMQNQVNEALVDVRDQRVELERLQGQLASTLKGVEDLRKEVDRALGRIDTFKSGIDDAQEHINTTRQAVSEALGLMHVAESNAERLRNEVQDTLKKIGIQREELEALKALRFEALSIVQTQRIRLLSNETNRDRIALATVLEYSREADPVVRMECVNAFAAIPGMLGFKLPKARIIERLNEIVIEDPEPAVRQEAARALVLFGFDPRNGSGGGGGQIIDPFHSDADDPKLLTAE